MSKPEFNELDIQPGYDVVEVGNKLETLFDGLAEAYPDKKIIWSSWDHDKWDRTAKYLCKAFGYTRGKELFSAFGYEVMEEAERKEDVSAAAQEAVSDQMGEAQEIPAGEEPAADEAVSDKSAGTDAVPAGITGITDPAEAETEVEDSKDDGVQQPESGANTCSEGPEEIPSEEPEKESDDEEEEASDGKKDFGITDDSTERKPYKKKFKVSFAQIFFILLFIATVAGVIWIVKFG